MSATATAADVGSGATALVGKDQNYERIILEPSPSQAKEIEETKG